MEIKWSDQYIKHPNKQKSLTRYCIENRQKKALVTSITTYRQVVHNDIQFSFLPSAICCYDMGRKEPMFDV